jgi:hypothetical protein
MLNKLTKFTSFFVIHVSKLDSSSTMLHVEPTYTNIIIWRESRFQPIFITIVCWSTNETKILDYYIWCLLWVDLSQKCYEIRKVKQPHSIYFTPCYSRMKRGFKFNYGSCRANIYEYHYLQMVRFAVPI